MAVYNSDILFILKRREDYDPVDHSPRTMSTGLFNSANYMHEMMLELGYNSNVEVAVDNNKIDALVTKYKPKFVVIEALWVVPDKFAVLEPLHPDVTWIVRLHSDMPFIANEGIAMDWIAGYATFPNVIIAPNAPRMYREVREYLKAVYDHTEADLDKKVVFLPNYYPMKGTKMLVPNKNKYWVDIACFGAVRPLKNVLTQAHGALEFARRNGKQLRFHINGGRVEQKGEPVMNNLKGMFENLNDTGHKLIIHPWVNRDEFLVLCKSMDIGMQVSFSETFNIVGADFVSQGVPFLGNAVEITWLSNFASASPVDSQDIAKKLHKTYHHPRINSFLNQESLNRYVVRTKLIWNSYFKGQLKK